MKQDDIKKIVYFQDMPLTEQLESISELKYQEILELGDQYVEQSQFQEAEYMLKLYLAYKKNDKLHPLFFLYVMNRLRIYTPFYCELVFSWSKIYKIESDASANGCLVGILIAQVMANSHVQVEMCTKWFLKFMDGLFAEKKSAGRLYVVETALMPKVSRAENNISTSAFKSRSEFEAYFEKKGKEFSKFFFFYFYNFSHFYENKEQYLAALERLSDCEWPWWGCPQWLDLEI